MSVLGGILLENEALNRALETLRPEDFYRGVHQKIFAGLILLSERSEPADLVTLTAVLKEQGTHEEVGGSAYLSSLVDFVPTAANISYYCRLVKEKAIARELIKVATEIASRGYEGGEVEASLDWAEGEIFKIANMKSRPSFYSTKDTGTGLGLAFVQRTLVDRGGSVEASDGSRGGACFRLRLPVATPDGSLDPSRNVTVAPASRRSLDGIDAIPKT